MEREKQRQYMADKGNVVEEVHLAGREKSENPTTPRPKPTTHHTPRNHQNFNDRLMASTQRRTLGT